MAVLGERVKRQKLLDTLSKEKDLEEQLFPSVNASVFDECSMSDQVAAARREGVQVLAINESKQLLAGEDRGPPSPPEGPETGFGRRAVWEDPDDAQVAVSIASQARLRKLREKEAEVAITGEEYEKRLRRQHQKLFVRTGWAEAQQNPEGGGLDEDAEKLLRKAGGLVGLSAALPPGSIEMSRLRDANWADPTDGVVRSVQFHPKGGLLMSAGLDKRLRLFKVDGTKNPKVGSIFLEDLPVHQAAFANEGRQVIASGRRKWFYVCDLEAGKLERVAGVFGREEKSFESFAATISPDMPLVAFLGSDGFVPLVSLKSRQLAGTLKMSGAVRAAAFSSDGMELLTSGSEGVVYSWDLRTQRCLGRQLDEGCLKGTALAAHPSGDMFASGSSSGVVNLYAVRRRDMASKAHAIPVAPSSIAPTKSFLNLTTTVDSLLFSPDGQVLAMASRMNKDALRLVHVASGSVFANWPTSRTPLGYVHSLDFSPHGGMFAVGNAKGHVLLYRLHHYPQG